MIRYTAAEKRILRKAARKAGQAAAAKLTPAQRKEKARKAARARWEKRKG